MDDGRRVVVREQDADTDRPRGVGLVKNDDALRARAKRVIPGGMYGHMSVRGLPKNYPQFFARAEGCRLWDVDDNEYVDFMCAYGPMIAGYGNPADPGCGRCATRSARHRERATSAVQIDLAERHGRHK